MWVSVLGRGGGMKRVGKYGEVWCKEMWGEVWESVLGCGGRCVRVWGEAC